MTKEIAVKTMAEADARAFVSSINKGLGDIREMLIELHDQMGWEALGHKSWEVCVKKEFGWDRRYADRQLSAGRIQKQLPPPTGQSIGPIGPSPIPESHLRPLAGLPEDQQLAAYTDAKEEAGATGETLTAKMVKAKADAYKPAPAPKPADDEYEKCPKCGGEDFHDDDTCASCVPTDAPAPTVEELMTASNKALESLAREITGAHKQAAELGVAHLDEERLGILKSQLRTAAGTLRAAKGYAVCSYCDGEGCKVCMKCGWLTRTLSESAPQTN